MNPFTAHGSMLTLGDSQLFTGVTLLLETRGFFFMRIEPLDDKVVVKRTEADETTAGGIVLPDAAREKPQEGRILSVGNGRLMSDGSRSDLQIRHLTLTSR